MNLLYVPLVIICLAAGALAYCFATGVPLTPIITEVQTRLSPLINAWNTLPPMVQGIVTFGVPSLISVFMMWTKNRAIQQNQELQLKADEMITQKSGEAYEAIERATAIEGKYEGLQEKYNTLAASNADVTALTSKLETSKENFDTLQRDYNTMERTLQNTINTLKQTEKVVIK